MEPGRIDHHDVQMALSVLLIVFTFKALEISRVAFIAGSIAAVMMAIGFETLPVIVVAGVFYFSLWFCRQTSAAILLRNFGSGFALSTLALFFATTPQALYFSVVCDAQSFASTLFALGAGASCAILAILSPHLRSYTQKFVAAFFCAAVTLAILYIYAKPCFSGPFAALPEDLRVKWLNEVFEAIGLGGHLKNDLPGSIPFAGPLIVSLGCALAAFFLQKHNRWQWGLLCALVIVNAALSFEHLRMLPYAVLFAFPASVWCITALRTKSQLAMALLYIASIPAVWALGAQSFAKPAALAGASSCGAPASFATIAKLPTGRVLAPIDLGPFLLAYTPHSVFGAPYHRNIGGMRFVFETLYERPEKARQKLHEKKVDYIILCDRLGEQRLIDKTASSLGARLMKNDALPGLTKLDIGAPMHVWRVH
jgi:hypothetical protein